MAELRWRVELYLRLVQARLRAQVQYRLSFGLDLIGAFLISFLDFLAIVILFTHLPRLAGWTLAEIAFFYGTANMAFAFCDLAVGHLDLFPRMIRTGSFDLMLVRPVGTLFQVISSDFALRRLGRVAQGLAVLIYAVHGIHVSWTLGRLAMFAGMLVTGTAIYAGVWVMGACISFWTVETQEVTNAFTYGGSFLASYPINIFGTWLRRFLAFVVPLGFVSYFPGLYVLDHPDPLGTPRLLQFCTPLICLALLVLAGRCWRLGTRHYRSTGS